MGLHQKNKSTSSILDDIPHSHTTHEFSFSLRFVTFGVWRSAICQNHNIFGKLRPSSLPRFGIGNIAHLHSFIIIFTHSDVIWIICMFWSPSDWFYVSGWHPNQNETKWGLDDGFVWANVNSFHSVVVWNTGMMEWPFNELTWHRNCKTR